MNDINPDEVDRNGVTIRMAAIQSGNFDMIHLAFDGKKDIDFSEQDRYGRSLLYYAYASNNPYVIAWLEEEFGVDFRSKAGELFIMACCNNETEIASRLVQMFRDNIGDPRPRAPVQAIYHDNVELLELLYGDNGILSESERNQLDPKGNVQCITPMSIACSVGHLSSVKFFVEHGHGLKSQHGNSFIDSLLNGCQILLWKLRNRFGHITKIEKVLSNYTETFKYILEQPGIDPNERFDANSEYSRRLCTNWSERLEISNKNLIHLVVLLGNSEMLRILLQKPEVDVYVCDGEAKTALDYVNEDMDRFKDGNVNPDLDTGYVDFLRKDSLEKKKLLEEYMVAHPKPNAD